MYLTVCIPAIRFSNQNHSNLAVDTMFLYIVFSLCLSFVQLPLLIFSLSFFPTVSLSHSSLCVSLSPCSISLHVPDNSCDLDTWRLVLEVRIGEDEVSQRGCQAGPFFSLSPARQLLVAAATRQRSSCLLSLWSVRSSAVIVQNGHGFRPLRPSVQGVEKICKSVSHGVGEGGGGFKREGAVHGEITTQRRRPNRSLHFNRIQL
jgi:hypothetical protein